MKYDQLIAARLARKIESETINAERFYSFQFLTEFTTEIIEEMKTNKDIILSWKTIYNFY